MSIQGNDSFTSLAPIIPISSINHVLSKPVMKALVRRANVGSTLVTVTAAVSQTLSAASLQQAGLTGLALATSGMTGACNLHLGGDTAANARILMDIFGLTAAGDNSTLSFINTTDNAATAVAGVLSLTNNVLGAVLTTFNSVVVQLNGSASHTQVLIRAKALPGPISVIVTATTVTVGAEVITFNIITPPLAIIQSGVGQLNNAGVVIIAATRATVVTNIFTQLNVTGGTTPTPLTIVTVVPGVSFSVVTGANHTSTFNWFILG